MIPILCAELIVLSVWGEGFLFFVICVSIGKFLKKVGESSLLSKYECLTPTIDQVMPV